MRQPGWPVIFRRRWYVLCLVGLLTIAGAWAVHHRKISYDGCEALALYGPALPWQGNALLDANNSLAMTTAAVTELIASPTSQSRILAAGANASYEVLQTNSGSSRFPSYTQPTLQICATSRDPSAVANTTAIVTRQFEVILKEIQLRTGSHHSSLIKVSIVTPTVSYPVVGRPSQAYLGVGLMGVLGGIALTLWSDPMLSRFSDRRRRSATVKFGT